MSFYLWKTCRICNFDTNCYDYNRIARHRKFTKYGVKLDQGKNILYLLTAVMGSFRKGHVPKRWKHANVNSVLKMHPPRLVENDLRQISLTVTLSKILESFVGGWILEAVRHQLDANQYGALKER